MVNNSIAGWDRDLFEKFLYDFCVSGATPITCIGAWLQMQELKDLIKNTTWNLPYAAFCRDENYKKLIPDFWKEDLFKGHYEDFTKFYEMVSAVSLDDFLAVYTSFVRQPRELAELRTELEKAGLITDKQRGYCILEAKSAYKAYRWKCGKDTDITDIFQGYLRKRNISIPDDLAFDILAFVTMYPFSSRKRKEKINATNACKILEKANCTPLKMLEIYKDIRQFIKADREYSNKANYIKAAKGLKNYRIDVGDTEAIEEAGRYLERIKRPSDFVGAVMERVNGDNSRIETGFVQDRFLEMVYPGDAILILNPSAYFIQTWPESLHSNTVFCITNIFEQILMQEEFPRTMFCLADTLDDIESFTKVLYFPHPTETDTQEKLINSICERNVASGTKKIGLMMLISPNDERVYKVKNSYQEIVIDELPRMTIDVEPKRRVVLTAAAGGDSKMTERHNRLKLFSQTKGTLDYKDRVPKGTDKLYLTFATKGESRLDGKKEERSAKHIDFSQDIQIWYKQRVSNSGGIRVEAALYTPPTEKQKHRNKNQRGVKLAGTSRSKVCPNEETKKDWLLNQYAYLPKIQSAMAELFRGKKSEVCLKTAWYLCLDLDRYKKQLTQEKGESELIPYFGDIQMNETDPERYREAMAKLRRDHSLTQEMEKVYWNILEKLISSLRKKGYCEKNIVSSINAEFRPRHTRESRLRDALTKRSFTKKETQVLYHSISAQVCPSDNTYLGLMLRLLTGLKVEILCGLKWADLKKLSGKENGYQLWIRRKVTPDGKECIGLDTNEEYRRYPLMELAANYLLDRRSYILDTLSIEESSLNKEFILASDAELADALCPIPKPGKWKRLGKNIIDQLHIKDVVLTLPSEDGEKETVLTSYHGDIFNMAFRYCLTYCCNISKAEERYLMGLRQRDTYSKHYLDFTNDALQQRIITKLDRMHEILSVIDQTPKSVTQYNPRNSLKEVEGKNGYCARVEMNICTEEDTVLVVTAESQHGENVEFYVSEVQDAEE